MQAFGSTKDETVDLLPKYGYKSQNENINRDVNAEVGHNYKYPTKYDATIRRRTRIVEV